MTWTPRKIYCLGCHLTLFVNLFCAVVGAMGMNQNGKLCFYLCIPLLHVCDHDEPNLRSKGICRKS